jgi:uncharacterized protein (TIGR02466 family)
MPMTNFNYYSPPTDPNAARKAPASIDAARPTMDDGVGSESSEQPRSIYGHQAPGEFELRPKTYWETTVFTRKYRDHDKDAASIIEHLYALKSGATANIASGIAPGSKSKDGLFESTFDLFETTQHPGLRRLIAFIESSVRRAVWFVNGRTVDPNRIRVTFKDSWFHITNNSGFHDAHYHGGCSWCGVYYLQISDVPTEYPDHAPNGVNRFYSPRPFGGMHSDFGNAYLGYGQFDAAPIPGTLVLFPAYLLHSGLPYEGDKDRVILSFNSTSTLEPETSSDATRG